MIETVYLIDGVRVTRKIYNRRRIFGEHHQAEFRMIEVRRERQC